VGIIQGDFEEDTMAATTRLRLSGIALALVATIAPLCAQAQANTQPSKEVKGGFDAMRRGQYDEAASRFERAVAASPEALEARLGLSWAYLKQRRFVPSAEQADRALALKPESARAHALMGTVLMRIGLLPEAAQIFGRALQLDGGEPLALAGAAELDLYAGSLAESIKRARAAVARAPREPDFLYLLAQTAARQEFFEEAAEAYERYLAVAHTVDADRRARIQGLVQLYRRLNGRNLYNLTGAKQVDVPLSISETRLPVVNLMINGQGPFKFVIDSGAGFVVVSEGLAKRLKLRPVAKGGTSRGVSGTGRFAIVYGILDRIDFGGLAIENVPTYIRKVHDSERTRVDGYIGLSVLSHFVVAVDFDSKRLELRPSGTPVAPPAEGDIAVPFRMTNGGMLSVRADIGKDVPLNFIVDTGATSTVVSQRAYERFNLAEKEHKGVTVRVIGAGGVTENVPIVVLDQLLIDGAARRQEFVRAIVLDLDPVNETAGFEQAGIIGSDYLRFYRVEFDFDTGRVVLRPNGRRSPPVPPGGST
jgi:predicted aspartyl protease